MADIKQRIAMKAVIVNDGGRVLVLRESDKEGNSHPGRYQIPGGQVEAGERFEVGLKREVKEESGLDVELVMPIYVGEWRPIIKGVQNQIVATYFLCKLTSKNEVVISDEHDKFAWIDPKNRGEIDLMDPVDKVLDKYIEVAAL